MTAGSVGVVPPPQSQQLVKLPSAQPRRRVSQKPRHTRTYNMMTLLQPNETLLS